MGLHVRVWCLIVLLVVPSFGQAPQNYLRNNSFVNWESAHVHPLDMTPDGTKLLAVNTANATLEVFDVSNASAPPAFLKSIPVGVDPVTVRARTNTEAWVVNVISDSVSVVDLTNGLVKQTLQTDDEPADVIFAGTGASEAFVSCAQAKTLLIFNAASPGTPTRVPINGEQPRALAVSSNGRYVYLAMFESGNGTTVLPGGVANGEEPSIVDDTRGPYKGVNPPPNSGTKFSPAINPASGTPPPVSLIVKRTVTNGTVKWIDDNNGDWSPFVTGAYSGNGTANAHASGWDLPDRDVAVIDTQSSNAVTYQSGLGNILMSMAVNPATGVISVVGTDATNQIRFEPNLQSTFVRVNLAQFAQGGSNTITDLNPQLNYQTRSIPVAQRQLAIGDPRGIVWNSAGSLAYVTGMGSNNVVVVNQSGARQGLIAVGQGPTGIVLQQANSRGFVLNKFDATISTINLNTLTQTSVTSLLYDPTTPEIKAGRPLLYNTQTTSGLGQASCASCHVDGKWDRLAWDLGDPQSLDITNAQGINFHPMKGPLLTMTLADTMQAPFFHWRGDRPGLTTFEAAFQTLMGADAPITDAQTAQLNHFLSEISLPPNPYRNLDDSYSTSVSMPGPNNGVYITGNAVLGAQEFESGCRSCHVGQTGRGANFITTNEPFGAGARNAPTWKNFYKRIGLWFTNATASNSGFGFQQDGTFDSSQNKTRDANMYAFMMSFNGGFPYEPAGLNASNWSNYTSASVGKQVTLTAANPTDSTGLLAQLESLAQNGTIGLIAKGTLPGSATRGYFYLGNGQWQSDKLAEVDQTSLLNSNIAGGWDYTFTSVPAESAVRMGVDMDGDGVLDGDDSSPSVPNDTVVDLALSGTATAASQYDALHGPAAAIDGSTNGYFDQNMLFASAGGNSDWWQVDLGQQSQISLVQLFNRVDCCSSNLSNVTVFVSPNPFTSTSLSATQAQAGVQQFFLTGNAGTLSQIPMSVQGRYVRVQLNVTQQLQLAEVRVMGYPVGSFESPGTQTTEVNTPVNLPLVLDEPAGTAYTFSATGLPPGLSISSTTGVISGVPTGTSNTSYNVTVSAAGTGNPTLSFVWNITYSAAFFTNPGSIITTQTGTAADLPLGFTSPEGSSYTFSATGLPPGLSINSATAEITGTPTGAAKTYSVTVTATGPGTPTITFPWNITTATPQQITFPGVASGGVGTSVGLAATSTSGLAVTFSSSTPSVCTVSGTTASFLTTGTCGIVASQAGNATYAAAAPVLQQIVVPLPQTITFNPIPPQAVGGSMTVSATASSGLPVFFTIALNGVCSLSGNSSLTFLTTGTCIVVANQDGNSTYAGAPAVGQAITVNNPVAQTITFGAIGAQAVGTSLTLGAKASSGLAVSYASTTPSVCAVSGSTASLLATGTCTITASQAGGNGYSAATPVTQSFAVGANLQAQTITFNAIPAQALGASLTVSATASSGLPVTFSLVPNGNCSVSGNVVTFLNVGNCGVLANQAGNSSYAAAPQVGQIVVVNNPIAQTITFGAIATQKAGTSLTLGATASSGLAVSYASTTPSVCTVSGSTVSLLAAGTCSITASQAGGNGYSAATPVTQSFTVGTSQQSQTITFNAIPAQVVGASLTVSATASSGLPVTFSLVPNGNCSVSGNVVTFLNVGNCGVLANQAGNSSYAAAPQVGQIVVVNNAPATQAAQTITFNAIPAQVVGASLTVSATASSGLPVTFTVVPNGNCSISGSVVTFLNVGNCGVVANQAGNSSYAAAPAVGQIIVVNNAPATQAAQTITFNAIPAQTVGAKLTVSATASSGLPVTFVLVPNGNCSISGNVVTFLNVGDCGVIATQPGNSSYKAAPAVGQVVVVN